MCIPYHLRIYWTTMFDTLGEKSSEDYSYFSNNTISMYVFLIFWKRWIKSSLAYVQKTGDTLIIQSLRAPVHLPLDLIPKYLSIPCIFLSHHQMQSWYMSCLCDQHVPCHKFNCPIITKHYYRPQKLMPHYHVSCH